MRAIRELYLLWCRIPRVAGHLVAVIGISTILAPASVLAQAAAAPQPLSPRNASYTINARLDPGRHTITGDEVLTWRNVTSQPAPTLQFHLYYNAWRDERSTW